MTEATHTYSVGEGAVLAPLSLTVSAGEMAVVTGPSGAGKSTLLSVAGLMMSPTSGTVEILGQDCSEMSETQRTTVRRSHVGFLFQEARLISHLTVLENVMVPRMASRRSAETDVAQAWLAELGLAQLSDRMPATLSGGQAHRVAYCRAIVDEPALVVADEPTGSLDEESAEAVRGLLSDYVARGGAALIATHDLGFLERSHKHIPLKRAASRASAVGGAR